MSKVITFQVAGRGEDSDAPTVEDLVDQLRDYFDLLGIVEGTVAVDGGTAIEWRIVEAHTNSPISFKAQAFARQFAVNVDARVAAVVEHTTGGLRQLQTGSDRPPFFTDQALQKAEKIFQRVTNGLAFTLIDAGDDAMPIDLKPSVARVAARNARSILEPSGQPYREIGSVEGYFQSVSWDGYGRRVLQLKHRLTGDDVKCFVKGEAERDIGHREIGDVLATPEDFRFRYPSLQSARTALSCGSGDCTFHPQRA